MSNFINLIEDSLKTDNGIIFIEDEIKLLFNNIKGKNNIEEAGLAFKTLEDIQFALAKAVFKDDLIVTPFLREFIYNFDRIDDNEVKDYLYNKIKGKVG